MDASLFDYHLPEELIAAAPAARRDESRLLVVPEDEHAPLAHRRFHDILEYLKPGDVLVANDTRVIPARLYGRRDTGGAVEVLLLEPREEGRWLAMVKPAKKLPPGAEFAIAERRVRVASVEETGERVLEVLDGTVEELLRAHGEMPLPPYILKRRDSLSEVQRAELERADADRYQTVYARSGRSVAAPTAGLHFTPELLERLRATGVAFERVTLQVGAGTFRPLSEGDIAAHVMHAEEYTIDAETAERLNAAKREGRRIVAVGTTATRALEAAALAGGGTIAAGTAHATLMIRPGFRFRAIDALVTNFHLPKSTLLVLLSAILGRERLLSIYAEAIRERYRFFSYGDAMFVERLPAGDG